MKSASWSRPAKDDWRRGFWGKVDEVLPLEMRRYAHVVILAGKDGLEIPLIVDGCGIPEENIHAVDYSAAMLATAPWRERWPGVRCYGVALSVAVRRIAATLTGDHRVRVVNLDFCSNITAALLDEMSLTGQALNISAGAVVQINLLKGRENPLVPVLLGQLGYESRADWALSWFLDSRSPLDRETYGSPGRPALTPVLRFHEQAGQYQDGCSPMQWARAVLGGRSRYKQYNGRITDIGYAFDWELRDEKPDGRGSFGDLPRAQFRVASDWISTRKLAFSTSAEIERLRALDILRARRDAEAVA